MSKPYISIVIPAYNEAYVLDKCLTSLAAQKHTKPFEVIVVDNASSDETPQIAHRYNVRVISEKVIGVCAARQAGLSAASGEIIISTDADCEFPEGWLMHIENTFSRQDDVGLLVGTYRFMDTSLPNRLLAAWERLAVRLHYAWGWQWYVSAANLAYRKKLFTGYDTRLGSGGDELYVVAQLKHRGRITFDVTNPVLTSARRLHGRFFATLLKDFGLKYIGGYWVSRFGKGARIHPAHFRASNIQRSSILPAVIGSLLLCCLVLGVFWGATYLVMWLLTSMHSFTTILGYTALALGGLAYITFWPRSQLVLPSPWQIRTKEKQIALTFDDGPNEPYTSQIAEIIESHGGRATFFQCGTLVSQMPGTTKKLVRAGHTIGNHTYDHSFWTLWRPHQLLKSIQHTNQDIIAASGSKVRFFRSPWLAKTPAVSWAVHKAGMTPVAGTFISLREVLQPDGVHMARRSLKKIKPGTILILHDSRETHRGNRSETVRAVSRLCDALVTDGYRLVSLDELL